MKVKIYIPTLTLVHKRGDDNYTASLQTFDPCSEWSDAMRVANLHLGFQKDTVNNDEGEDVIKFKGTVVNGYSTVKEFVIDTDDYDEHKPTYEVELTVVQTKVFTVEVTADQIEERGYDVDEYGASQAAEEMFNDDEFTDEYEDCYPDDTTVDAEACELD